MQGFVKEENLFFYSFELSWSVTHQVRQSDCLISRDERRD